MPKPLRDPSPVGAAKGVPSLHRSSNHGRGRRRSFPLFQQNYTVGVGPLAGIGDAPAVCRLGEHLVVYHDQTGGEVTAKSTEQFSISGVLSEIPIKIIDPDTLRISERLFRRIINFTSRRGGTWPSLSFILPPRRTACPRSSGFRRYPASPFQTSLTFCDPVLILIKAFRMMVPPPSWRTWTRITRGNQRFPNFVR